MCVFSIIQYSIFILPVAMPSCPLSFLAVALLPSIPFGVMGCSFSSLSVTVSCPCAATSTATCTEFKQRSICIDNTAVHVFLCGTYIAFTHTQGDCVCVCDCLKSEQPPSASAYGRGELAKQPRAYLANIKASGCAALRAHQRPRGRSKTACTSPPPTKSVHVDFKNACARNPPARAQQTMRSTRRPILWANVRIFRGSAAPSSPGKPHSKP